MGVYGYCYIGFYEYVDVVVVVVNGYGQFWFQFFFEFVKYSVFFLEINNWVNFVGYFFFIVENQFVSVNVVNIKFFVDFFSEVYKFVV